MRLRSGLLIGIFGLIVVLLGGWFFTLATALLTYLALLEFFRMAEFKGIKPATKTTLFSSFIIIISSYLETIGVLEGEISNSILPIRPHASGQVYKLNMGQYNTTLSLSLHYKL